MKSQHSILQEAVSLLGTTLTMVDEAITEEMGKDIGRSFVYRHAVYIRDLATDALFLGREGRWASIYVLGRPAMESAFKMAAAVVDSEFPAQKVAAELKEERKRLVKWRNSRICGLNSVLDEAAQQCEEFEKELRKRYGVASKREWSVRDVAELGKLTAEYTKDYFQSSKHIHGMLSGLLGREQGLYVPDAVYSLTSTITMAIVLLGVYFRIPVDLSPDALGMIREAKVACDLAQAQLVATIDSALVR